MHKIKIILLLLSLPLFNFVDAQIDQPFFHFQAIARDHFEHPISLTEIKIKVQLLEDTISKQILYEELHRQKTDDVGLFSIEIGKGDMHGGQFNSLQSIDWTRKNYYVRICIATLPEINNISFDVNSNWIDLGMSQLGVVPYAMYAFKSSNVFDSNLLASKLNIIDTANMLHSYTQKKDYDILLSNLNKKIGYDDTTQLLKNYITLSLFQNILKDKLNISDSILRYVTPAMLSAHKLDTSYFNTILAKKLNYIDTANLLNGYVRKGTMMPFNGTISYDSIFNKPYLFSGNYLELTNKPILFDGDYNRLLNKPQLFSGNYFDLSNLPVLFNGDYNLLYNKPTLFSGNYIDLINKPVLFDGDFTHLTNTPLLFSGNYNDLISKPNLNVKEDNVNKSVDILLDANSNIKYPSVRAVKMYVDATVLAGAPDADGFTKGIIKLAGDLTGSATMPRLAENSITTNKILDGAVTNEKLSFGISANKVGLGNVTNHPQLYSLNGLTDQVQNFAVPGVLGTSPNWVSNASSHTLHIPMASSNNVTAGLLSKLDYDRFDATSSLSIEAVTSVGNSGAALLSNHVLNIPNYTLAGLSGNVSPNTFYAGPVNGSPNIPTFRILDAIDIPNNNANTSGNAATATTLQNVRTINNIPFNGSNDILITANTPNNIEFNNGGTGEGTGVQFNGSVSKIISYNTIGAAPSSGSTSINTLGTITSGTWHGSVIGSNFGGAGSNNGLLKANGSGVVSSALANTDYQSPISVTVPLQINNNNIVLPVSSASTNGYLSSSDWNYFNNKINMSEKGAANGVANLDANGKIATSMIPAISFSTGVVVNSQAEMLNLSNAVTGTIAIRTDNNNNYVLSGTPASLLSNWIQLAMPTSVQTVNGITGVNINLTTNNINEGSTNKYFSNTLARNAFNVASPLNYDASSGIFSITAASATNGGFLNASDWNLFNNKLSAFGNQTQNYVYASPDASNGVPVFRALVANDIPLLNQNTTGTASNITATSNSSLQTLSSLSSIGTIATGVWHGSIVSPQYGGTGTNNGNKAIVLGGNLTTAGSFTTAGSYSITLNTFNNTNLNLPITGTLTTLAGVENFTNKTINGLSFTNNTNGFLITGGSSITKTLTLNDNAIISGNNSGDQTITLTGDLSGTGTGTFSTTLSSTGVVASSYGTSNKIPSITVDTKGRITNANEVAIANLAVTSLALPNGQILIGDANNVATGITLTGDITVNNLGISTIGNNKVTNSMLLGNIAASKLIGTDINSVGTITSGNWNAGMISGQYGGTGINNGTKTISLGGNLTTAGTLNFSGNYTSTLTMTGNTNITLPTTGTLSTLNGVETLVNKTMTSPLLVTPNLGVASATTITSGTITATSDITAKRFVLTNNVINSSLNTTLDLSGGNVITVNMISNITTLNVTGGLVGTYLIKFVQDGTGNRTIAFPASWKWAGGITPLLTTTANKLDIVTLIYDGTNYYSTIVQNF